MATFVLCDSREDVRLALVVSPDGFAMISATHRDGNGDIDDSFRLVVSNGEPEMIMKDAIFADTAIMSARGFFASGRGDK